MTVEYVQFGDTQVTVAAGAPVILQFNTVNPDPNEPANLAYNLRPAGLSTVEVRLNGNVIIPGLTMNSNNARAMLENVRGTQLVNGVNALELIVTAGAPIGFSDFRMTYKV